jgi:hypothetical protein
MSLIGPRLDLQVDQSQDLAPTFPAIKWSSAVVLELKAPASGLLPAEKRPAKDHVPPALTRPLTLRWRTCASGGLDTVASISYCSGYGVVKLRTSQWMENGGYANLSVIFK